MTDTVGMGSAELRKFADLIDQAVETLGEPEECPPDSWKWGIRIDVDFDGILYGTISPHGDGWWQFSEK